MPKKVLIALPPAMLEQVDLIAGAEHRTRSDLIREALRRYIGASRVPVAFPQPAPSATPSYEVANAG